MNNIQFFTKFLEDNKFSKGDKLHPEFIKVLQTYDSEGYGVIETIVHSIREYAPKLSHVEMAAVCTELTENIFQIGGKMAEELQKDFADIGITERQSYDEFNIMVEEIRKEQSLV